MGVTKITEEQKVHEEWYKEADAMQYEQLPDFINKLMTTYQHDYGTIVHAIASGCIATAQAMNRHENGGITGFQAGAVMWQFIKGYLYSSNKTGLRLINYDDFLYPQNHNRFQKIIDSDVWENIQKEAKRNIEAADKELNEYLLAKEKYKADLAAFYVKYPDAKENPEKYTRLAMCTAEQHEEQKQKEKDGFEFMPTKPYCSWATDSPVYAHWQDIVEGKVPFGYKIGKA